MPDGLSNTTRATSLAEILSLQVERPDSHNTAPIAITVASCPPLAPPFLSLREAADFLSISLSTLHRLLAKGELVAVRIGARRRVPADHLTAYLTRDVQFPELMAGSEWDRSNQINRSKT